MKKIIIILCIFSSFIICRTSGCTTKKEDVKLKTEKEIVQYTSKKYGKSNYVNKKDNSDSIKYILHDDEYKFNYECYSRVQNFCVDGSCSIYYYEETRCDFDTNTEIILMITTLLYMIIIIPILVYIA